MSSSSRLKPIQTAICAVALTFAGCTKSTDVSPIDGDEEPDAAAGESGSSGAGASGATSAGAGGSSAGRAGSEAGKGGSSGGSSGAAGSAGKAGGSGAGAGGAAGAMAGAGGSSGKAGSSGAAGGGGASTERFSFFVASFAALQRVSKSENGFGGDLRYGEADGLRGADKICTEIAEGALAGAGKKTWRAFLSVTKGADGKPVNAIDRVGEGPWYDRLGRLVAQNKTDLNMTRPSGADAAIVNDLPNEDGVPNHAPDGMQVDNHDILTGTNETGQLFNTDWKFTCHDWTSSVGADGTPRVGHSWPRSVGGSMMGGGGRSSGANWMSALNEAGCAAGASLIEMGGPKANNPTVGSGGGYGGIYCFALTP